MYLELLEDTNGYNLESQKTVFFSHKLMGDHRSYMLTNQLHSTMSQEFSFPLLSALRLCSSQDNQCLIRFRLEEEWLLYNALQNSNHHHCCKGLTSLISISEHLKLGKIQELLQNEGILETNLKCDGAELRKKTLVFR